MNIDTISSSPNYFVAHKISNRKRIRKHKYLSRRRRRGKDQLYAIFHYNVFEKFHVSFVVRSQEQFSSSLFSKITILLSRNLSPSHFD